MFMRTLITPFLAIVAACFPLCPAFGAPSPNACEFISVALGQNHMNFYECYSFDLRWSQKEGKWLLDANFARRSGPREGERIELQNASASDELVLAVADILKKHNAHSWSTSRRLQLFHALDETTWRASIAFGDGKKLELGSSLKVNGGNGIALQQDLRDCLAHYLTAE